MLQPYQSLLYCARSATQQSDILLAASGCCIFSFSVQNGDLISTWPIPLQRSGENAAKIADSQDLESEHQAKRQKISLSRDPSGSDSADIVVENRVDIDSSKKRPAGSLPNVTKLACTSNGKYVVAVTAEDKAIRVFELSNDGSLLQISERPMPKRPCTITLTPDDSQIICGDKFGDVYSLPLLGMVFESARPEIMDNRDGDSTKPPEKPFLPTASSRTVHTKKNLEALRNQQKQPKQKLEKQVLRFEHQLLLGHVSLLTDLAYVRLNHEDSPSDRTRDYIITSDRDEHIRVSRGIPQAHVIEGYCLGHTEFISAICIPHRHRQLLVSGGGEDFLIVWDWLSGKLRQKINLWKQVGKVRDLEYGKDGPQIKSNYYNNGSKGNIAVTKILATPNMQTVPPGIELVVACEAVPALFLFAFNAQLELEWRSTVTTGFNVMDVAIMGDGSGLVYSTDVFTKAGTTTSSSSEKDITSRDWVGFPNLTLDRIPQPEGYTPRSLATTMNQSAKNLMPLENSVDRLPLYTLEPLRKRDQEE